MELKGRGRSLCLATLVLIVIALVIVWPREKRLMDRATLVTNNTNWDFRNSYDWLSDHELLYLRVNKDNEEAGEDARILRYDVRTGAETPLDPLTKLFRRSESEQFFYLSPDHTHILWNGKNQETFVARLDGSGVQHYKKQSSTSPTEWLFWLGDSRHWAEQIDSQDDSGAVCIHVHDIDAPSQNRLLPVEQGKPWNNSYFDFTGNSPTGSMRVFGENSNPDDEVRIDDVVEMDLAVSAKPLHAYHVVLPMPAKIEETQVSQDGKKIAWILYTTQHPPALFRWLPFRFQAHSIWSLWVSRPDGGDMQEIGQVRGVADSSATTARNADEAPRDAPSSLEWTPDDKHLSFQYADSLWTVPAE